MTSLELKLTVAVIVTIFFLPYYNSNGLHMAPRSRFGFPVSSILRVGAYSKPV